MINLIDFCSIDSMISYALSHPFAEGEYSYATNGWILVRLNNNEGKYQAHPDKDFAKMVTEMKLDPDHEGKWIAITDIDIGEQAECEGCSGTGLVTTYYDCEECNGEGDVYWCSDYHEYCDTCKECYGTGTGKASGEEECRKCGGTGKSYNSDGVKVSGVMVSKAELAKLARIPGAEAYFPCREDDCVCLRFEGGKGVLMRMEGKG